MGTHIARIICMNDSLQALTFRSFVLFRQQKKKKKTFSRLQSCRTFSPPFFYIKYIGKSILYRDSVHNNNNSREWLAFLCASSNFEFYLFFYYYGYKEKRSPLSNSAVAPHRQRRTDGHNGDADGNSESLLLFKKVLTIQIFSVPVKDKEK